MRRNIIDQFERVAESESENCEEEINPGLKTARSERGLKRLSVKVRDLVYRLKETSYKDVANRLIEELVFDNEVNSSGLDKKSSNERKTKEEKNVRRRVYDALNVLIASGVLRKNLNKNVMFEERPEVRMKGLKLTMKKKYENSKKNLIKAIYFKRKLLQEKHLQANEGMDRLKAISYLIRRNKEKEERERRSSNLMSNELQVKINEDKRRSSASRIYTEVVEKINFPFIILSTPN